MSGGRLAGNYPGVVHTPAVKSERVQPDPGPAPGNEGFLGCRPAVPGQGAALAQTELSVKA
jgi:hypothetical protein